MHERNPRQPNTVIYLSRFGRRFQKRSYRLSLLFCTRAIRIFRSHIVHRQSRKGSSKLLSDACIIQAERFSKRTSFQNKVLLPVCRVNQLHLPLPDVSRLMAGALRSVTQLSVSRGTSSMTTGDWGLFRSVQWKQVKQVSPPSSSVLLS